MAPPRDEDYRDASGTILMCMYCRRTLRVAPGEPQWELVDRYLTIPPRGISHGLCPECLDKHYPPESPG